MRWPDLLEACGEECADLGNDLVTLFDAPAELRADALSELRTWLERSEHHLAAMRREADEALPWLWRLADAPAGADELAMELGRLLSPTEPIGASRRLAADADRVLRRCEVETANPAIRQWLAALDEDIGRGLSHWRQLEEGLGTLAGRASDFAEAMNFEPLYDRNERLFFIGYNVSDDRMDQHHYDLLASEARLASFFAIAKQDVPAEHWFQLGRPIVKRRGELALVSWNGSMFEYLMPRLFLRSDAGTLLSESNGSSVDIQRRYGAARGIPWGISESGFGSVSSDATWRYRAFGVPQLGLRRGLSEDLVVAPYSTALALAVRSKDAVENMRELAAIGALGRCGFYEALDFTKGRRGEGEAYRLVKSHMSHHMGMSIAAIANVLFDDIFVRLFHQDARVQTVDLLLHERVPWELPPEVERIEPFAAQAVQDTVAPRSQPWTPSGQIAPALYALGNGQLTSLIGEDGSGELLWRGQALTRPGDAGEGNGHFVYLRDVESGDAWSATSAPVRGGERRRTRFHAHKVEFRCQSGGISSRLELMVAPAENVQIRRLRLVNKTPATRTIEVASHAEIALAPPADWSRHPAFARMFVAAGTHPEFAALSFERRARDPAETAPVMVERLVADETGVRLTGWEVSRAVTRGRHGTAAAFPVFSGRLGPRPRFPLDPASALLTEVVLPPRGEAELAFVTSAAATLEDALELARRYGSLGSLDWAEQDAAERSARELQDLGLAQDRLADAQLLFSVLHTRSGPQFAGEGTAGREDLWAMGLSGDQPILLVELPDEFDIGELRFLLAAHRQWRWRGCKVDLALLHPGLPGYVEPMRERLLDLLREAGSLDLQGERGGIHILGREQIQPGRVDALREAAAVGLTASGVPVGEQLERRLPEPALSPAFTTSGRDFDAPPDAGLLAPDLRFHNGIGGFGANGNYVLDMGAGKTTPAPWSNVLANEHFGAIVTEAGLGCTFAGNSGENRLTPWHNDPLSDLQGEALYLRDEETAAVWTVAPLPAGRKNACQIEHGPGKTVWRRESEGLSQEMSCCVADSDPVKLVRVRLTDRLGVVRRITATYFADWLLGADAQEPGPFRRSWYRADFHALLAQNRWHREFAGRIAFLAATEPPHSLTTSRREFLGQPPDWRRPQGLVAWDPGNRLQNRGEDSGAALQLYFDIPAGGSCEFAFVLGQTGTESEAAELIARWQDIDKVADEFDRVERHWDERLGSLRVDTPDPALDLMVNRWLPCQAIASRLFARAGFYQAGGAFGFRDQLQDVLALLVVDPRLARDQILRAAAHQFEEGDVLHWWHPPSGRGVRTRCSDDLLWLPFTVARYVEATGDHALLDERAPFLHAAELLEDEHDRYAEFSAQGEASIHEHCLRAFDRAWRLGEHGLPLIGDGDWNDGMNRVGHGGKGESVWLAWFMAATIRNFAAMERALGRDGFGEPWLARAEQLVAAIERHGWDGEWYMRAFDDLGRPWGSRENEECNIDSISQSWAVIAGGGDPKRARTALDSAFARLVRPGEGIVRLLDPPFAETLRDPGYIKAYPPGIRENGGQYSHAAAWLGIALAMQGDGDRAKEVFDRLNPILHSDTREQTERYLVEPYVVAADIGGADPHLGRGGWSWYTGAAAWSWRLAVEHMLGIRLMDGGIEVRPCLPSDWNGFEATVMGEGSIEITVKRGAESRLTVDGVATSFDGDPIAFPGKCKVRRVRLIIAASARKPHAHDANGSRVQGQAVRG
ncbi:MAG TPA: glucoamylase family protein [Sphingomonadaceae bacterium]|nr:glucoamylase family protein [Sphingomonadaceae bacterium]